MILVTGGTGLVGGHLLYRFRESELPIIALYRDKKQLDKTRAIFESYAKGDGALIERFKWVQGDITEVPSLEAVMPGVTTIYHCAALLEGSFNALKSVNVMGTENVVNVALAHGVSRICFVSSIATLGEPVGNRPINEDDFFNLDARNSDYALSKFGAEMEVWRASQEGIEVVIVNPGVILGEGNWHRGSGKLFTKTASGQPFYTSGASGFVDVRDVVAIMDMLMQRDMVNERFIVVAVNESYKNVLSEIATALGKRPPYIHLKKWMLYMLHLPQLLDRFFGFKKSLSRAAINTLVAKSCYSNEAVTMQLSHEFIPLKETVNRIARCFLGKTPG